MEKEPSKIIQLPQESERHWQRELEPLYRGELASQGYPKDMIDYVCKQLKMAYITHDKIRPLNCQVSDEAHERVLEVIKDFQNTVTGLMFELMKREVSIWLLKDSQNRL